MLKNNPYYIALKNLEKKGDKCSEKNCKNCMFLHNCLSIEFDKLRRETEKMGVKYVCKRG